eukprot:scaffold28587_cov18-Tisochrysis_lutea.AAC.1
MLASEHVAGRPAPPHLGFYQITGSTVLWNLPLVEGHANVFRHGSFSQHTSHCNFATPPAAQSFGGWRMCATVLLHGRFSLTTPSTHLPSPRTRLDLGVADC